MLAMPCMSAGVGKCFSIHTRWDVVPSEQAAGSGALAACRLTARYQVRWERFHPVKGPAGRATAKECVAMYQKLKVGMQKTCWCSCTDHCTGHGVYRERQL